MPKPLPLTVAQLTDLVAEYGTPLQIYSEQGIRQQASSLHEAFRKHGFDSFKEYFAVKALPNPAVLLSLTRDGGCGLDCSSTGELWIADKVGCKDVMYTSNYTSKEDLKKAVIQKVIINLDDASLVDSLKETCEENRLPFPELMCFRLNPGTGNTASETASNLLGGPSAKFGVPPEQIEEAYRKAKQYGARRFGIHMMTGSCVLDEEYWALTVSKLLETLKSLREKLSIEFEFVNIGGGIGIPYQPGKAEVDLNNVASIVARAFQKAFGADKAKWPRLYMENGRFITGPYGWLVTRCHAVKSSFGTRYYGVDATMANLMRPGMYGSYHHITVPEAELRGEPVELANVVGTLCENNDWFAKDRHLPRSRPGDLFVIHDTGAHGHSMGFQYNAKLRAPEVMIDMKGTPQLIREREVIQDLFANTILPDSIRGNLPRRLAVRPAQLIDGLTVQQQIGFVSTSLVVAGAIAYLICRVCDNRNK